MGVLVMDLEKEQKEYEKDLYLALEKELTNTFTDCFDREGLQKGSINLSLKSTRDDILNHIPENEAEYDFLNKNYERILSKVQKIYENDERAKQKYLEIELQKQLAEQQKEAEKDAKFERNIKIIGSIFKWALIIIFAPIVLLFIFISMCAKNK